MTLLHPRVFWLPGNGCDRCGSSSDMPLFCCSTKKKSKKTLKSNFCRPSVLISPVLLRETSTAATPASTRLVLNKNNWQLFAFNVRQVETWGPVSCPAVVATIEQQFFTQHRFTCVDFFHGLFFKHLIFCFHLSIFSHNDSVFFFLLTRKSDCKTFEWNHQNFGLDCYNRLLSSVVRHLICARNTKIFMFQKFKEPVMWLDMHVYIRMLS